MAQGRITYGADGDYVDKQLKEFTLTQEVIEKLDSIEPGAERNYIQGIKVNGEIQTPDQYRVVDLSIPEVEDTLSSYNNTAALSARQGRVLYNYIKDLQQVGHFLSNWNCATGLPQTNPQVNPYVYKSGDYFIVSNVGSGTNYRPNGAQYVVGQASTTVESDEVNISDFYFYDGSNWLLLSNSGRTIAIDTSLSTTSTNPVENRVITNALNLKANDADISTVGKSNDYNDLDNLPSIPDSLDDLSGDSDDIIEGSAHLFLTSSERTNLSHQSGINTGDENQGSIKQKLGAASSSSDGYLTSTDWNTFNDKQDEISDLSDIRNNATAGKNASDTIATYGDVVTHDANEFATAAQGAKADTALQSGDNVSELTNDAGYITSADIPTLDTAMSSTSTKGVQNKVIKSYVDTQVQEATSGAVSDTAYGSSWDGVTGIAPSKNAVYDKISAMDTTISGKQDTISDLATIRTGAGKGATAVQPGDNISTLTNNSGYITKAVNDLTNYYTKSETYTKAEVADYVANFAGFKVVSTLPTTDIKTTIIYLLGPIGSGADKYEEWIYSNNAWVKIGETTVDLTNYFNKTTNDTDDITEGNNKFVTTSEKNTWNAKQNALTTQTAYSAKGSATKVPQITTNNLGQVTGITEVTITQPTVNNSTITYTQAGDTITTTTTNQSSASIVSLRGDIFVTQTEYNNLPSTKTTDGNTYIIYKT